MPVHLARFHRPFCRGGTETWFTSHVFTDLSITVVPNSGPPRMVSLHFCAGGRSAGPPRTFFLWFLARWSRMPVHPAHFCTLLHAFAHFSAFYPKRGLLFLVNYRSLLAFREETITDKSAYLAQEIAGFAVHLVQR